MKSLILLLSFALFALSSFGAENTESYPPEGWETNIFKAVAKAEKENKKILINFTGSDWCGYCIRLENSIFSKEEFKEYAEKELIRVFIDFPRRKELDEYQLNHNHALQAGFNVEGFPTIIVLEPNMQLSLITGYQNITPQEYVEHLRNDNIGDALSEEDNKQFAEEFKSFLTQIEGALASIVATEASEAADD